MAGTWLKFCLSAVSVVALLLPTFGVAIEGRNSKIGAEVKNLTTQAKAVRSEPDDKIYNFYFASDLNDTSKNAVSEPRFIAVFANSKVYYVMFIQLNWHSAAEFCSSQNYALASINSADENQNLIQRLEQTGVLYNDANFWVGGSELGHPGRWAWLGNGRPFNYNNWLPGEPNNYRGLEHCLQLRSDGRWNDQNCEETNYVICENRCGYNGY